MKAKNILAVLLASIALMALLGCVQEEASPLQQGSQQSPDEGLAAGEQVVGPEYYDSEQAAFDALNQELDQMEDISLQDICTNLVT